MQDRMEQQTALVSAVAANHHAAVLTGQTAAMLHQKAA